MIVRASWIAIDPIPYPPRFRPLPNSNSPETRSLTAPDGSRAGDPVADAHAVLARPALVELDLPGARARVAAGDLPGVGRVGLGVVDAHHVELG